VRTPDDGPDVIEPDAQVLERVLARLRELEPSAVAITVRGIRR
jgi:hypothetical protein